MLVPLTRNYTVLDLINELSVPALVVSRARLGTINHTSLTINALKSKNISIIGIIMNCFKGGVIEEDNQKIINQLNGVPIIGVVPFSKNLKKLADNFEKYINIKNFISER